MLRIHVRPSTPPALFGFCSLLLCLLCLPAALSGCGHSTVRVDGVMQQSSEMRPLPNVPLGGYQQLRLFVRAASQQDAAQYGSADCGFAMLEGTDEGQDLKNAACVPADALNTAVGLVRQRLRAYGITVVRGATEPYDYKVEVTLTGEAPRKADRTLAKALVTIMFKLNTEAVGGTLMSTVATEPATRAFAQVAKDCSLKDADLSVFWATSRQPMTPDFDVLALTSDAVDNVLRCTDLAQFFLDAKTRFPR
jgi:hypothetical protein